VSCEDLPIFLVGFMGSGKTAVGQALARRLGRVFLDTDTLVVEREGRSIDAIFRESGEGRFREAEWEALRSLEGIRGAVVAAGGGLFLGHAQRAWLKRRGRTVWLDVRLEVARDRVGRGGDRPLWLPDDPVALRALFEKRRAVYALAELRVEASAGGPGQVAGRVEELLARISH